MTTQRTDSAGPKVLGVIIARGGSKGLPGKHTYPLLGKPLVEYTIEAALAAESLEAVVLTSDDEDVRKIARRYPIWVVGRPEELATDNATVDSAARYGCDQARTLMGFDADFAAILYGNIPIRPAGLIDMAVEHLIESGGDSCQTYSPVGKMHPDWMVTLDDDRVKLNCEKPIYRRQDLRPMFMPNGAVVAVTRKSIYRKPAHAADFHAFLGKDRRGVVHPESHLIVDVDELRDAFIAEAVLRCMQETADERKCEQPVLA